METGSVVLSAIGLVFVLEGLLYALFPSGMKRTVAKLLEMPDSKVRDVGLVAVAVGVFIVWLAK